jgi:hypothetical protein
VRLIVRWNCRQPLFIWFLFIVFVCIYYFYIHARTSSCILYINVGENVGIGDQFPSPKFESHWTASLTKRDINCFPASNTLTSPSALLNTEPVSLLILLFSFRYVQQSCHKELFVFRDFPHSPSSKSRVTAGGRYCMEGWHLHSKQALYWTT